MKREEHDEERERERKSRGNGTPGTERKGNTRLKEQRRQFKLQTIKSKPLARAPKQLSRTLTLRARHTCACARVRRRGNRIGRLSSQSLRTSTRPTSHYALREPGRKPGASLLYTRARLSVTGPGLKHGASLYTRGISLFCTTHYGVGGAWGWLVSRSFLLLQVCHVDDDNIAHFVFTNVHRAPRRFTW